MQLKPDSYWAKKIKEAIERLENLPKEAQDEHWKAQKESFIRANMPTGDKRFD